MSIADYLLWKSMQPTTIRKVETVQAQGGILKNIWLQVGKDQVVPANKRWEIQCGMVHHITGTNTIFNCRNGALNLAFFTNKILAAVETGGQTLDLKGGKVVLEEDDFMVLAGGTVLGALIRVVETSL